MDNVILFLPVSDELIKKATNQYQMMTASTVSGTGTSEMGLPGTESTHSLNNRNISTGTTTTITTPTTKKNPNYGHDHDHDLSDASNTRVNTTLPSGAGGDNGNHDDSRNTYESIYEKELS